eukprot:COSAG02_NODE_2394_length_8958_cov_174.117478_4_plen_276_part_00
MYTTGDQDTIFCLAILTPHTTNADLCKQRMQLSVGKRRLQQHVLQCHSVAGPTCTKNCWKTAGPTQRVSGRQMVARTNCVLPCVTISFSVVEWVLIHTRSVERTTCGAAVAPSESVKEPDRLRRLPHQLERAGTSRPAVNRYAARMQLVRQFPQCAVSLADALYCPFCGKGYCEIDTTRASYYCDECKDWCTTSIQRCLEGAGFSPTLTTCRPACPLSDAAACLQFTPTEMDLTQCPSFWYQISGCSTISDCEEQVRSCHAVYTSESLMVCAENY